LCVFLGQGVGILAKTCLIFNVAHKTNHQHSTHADMGGIWLIESHN